MESPDLNPLSSRDADDRRLEQWLRQAQPELPDDGFSNRVLSALPAPLPARSTPTRALLCLAATAAGGALAAIRIAELGGWTALRATVAHQTLAFENTATLSLASLPPDNLGLAATVTAVSLAYAFRGALTRHWSACFG